MNVHYHKHLCIQHKTATAENWKYCELIIRDEMMTQDLKLQNILQTSDPEIPPRTLILGTPGIGKTSLAVELCRKWAYGQLLQEYKYVILLWANNPRIRGATEICHFVPQEQEEWIVQVKRDNGRGCLFILDGYDELVPSENKPESESIFYRLVRRDLFSEASLIVTTRPWCRNEISTFFSSEIEIVGFSLQGRSTFIRQNLNNPDKFNSFLMSFPKVYIECFLSTPLHLTTLIKIYKKDYEGIQCKSIDVSSQKNLYTLTRVYGALVQNLVLRFINKNKKMEEKMPESFKIKPGEFNKLPRVIFNYFMQLCEVSFESTIKQTTSLELSKDFLTFDLLVKHKYETESERTWYYEFLHSSIKEYLTAYYISQAHSEDIRKCFQSMKKFSRFSLVLEFLCGFGQVPSDCFAVEKSISNLSIVRQLCEACSADLIRKLFEQYSEVNIFHTVSSPIAADFTLSLPKAIEIPWSQPTMTDFWCLGRVIALSTCKWNLGFTHRNIQNSHIEMLCEGIKSVDPEAVKGQIKTFNFSLNSFDEQGLSHILSLNPYFLLSTNYINFRGNSLKIAAVEMLCKGLLLFPNLRRFLFHENNLDSGDHFALIEILLGQMDFIEQVSFSNLSKHECQLLFRPSKTLRIVELWQLNKSSVKAVVDLIPSQVSGSCLERLEIHQSKVTDECLESLSETLPISSITSLVMSNCSIDCKTTRLIVSASQRLNLLDLSNNAIKDEGGYQLLTLPEDVDLCDTNKRNYFSEEMCQLLQKRNKCAVVIPSL